ncbi:hypothetical protein BDV12DRAFT_178763 [Aspergillus spectabilis]
MNRPNTMSQSQSIVACGPGSNHDTDIHVELGGSKVIVLRVFGCGPYCSAFI